MAAEVPAKDVLCEAMEYLSKLGSNLRTRSESLREKKIRREKLNNVLAVQKAASKVLLICELSKKSLENVENGVRKVLQLIDRSQGSSNDGGKKSESRNDTKKSETQEDSHPVYYFKYKSRKLRIKSRISFKHYNSVRVYAKSLPQSMLDKYPVHYDCKLYRMRKKQAHLQIQKELARNKSVADTNDVSIISIPDTPDSKSTADRNSEPKTASSKNKNDISVISIPDSPELRDNEKSVKSPGVKDLRRPSVDATKDEKVKRVGGKSPVKQVNDNNVFNDTEKSCSDNRSSKENETENKKCLETDTSDEKADRDLKRKSKRKRVISDSSSSDDKDAAKHNDSDVGQESDSKKRKLNEESNIVTEKENDDSANDSKKPMIKCVSLSKLLKPNVLEKEGIKRGPHSTPRDSKVLSEKQKILEMIAKQKEKAEQIKKCEKEARKRKEEEEYWIRKRKEVSTFKPTSFVINVTRLPELTECYLNKLKLRKITQNGVTICEVISKNLKVGEQKEDEICLESNSRRSSKNSFDDSALIDEANKVKNSLLNESDSEDMGSGIESISSKNDTEVIRNALLNDSDSDSKKSDNESQLNDNQKDKDETDKTQKAKLALCNDSDSDKNEMESSGGPSEQVSKQTDQNEGADRVETDKTQKAKQALCGDSESDKSDMESSAGPSEQVTKLIDQNDDSDRVNSPPVSEPNSDSDEQKRDSGNGVQALEKISHEIHSDKDDSEDNSNKNKTADSLLHNDENSSDNQRNKNETTPEKQAKDEDIAKSSLLDDSSDDKSKTPLSQRLTLQSKNKHMQQSVQAKKMLLTYSSSDTEDEQLVEALKEIKDSLLHGSDEENKEQKKKETSQSSSDEEIINKNKKKKKLKSDKEKRHKHKHMKHRKRLDSGDSSSNSGASKSSKSKMVRSKSKPGNSSCQNSDGPDSSDKDIDGLTNLKSLNKPRRRNSNSSQMSDESNATSNTKSNKSNTKPTGLISEEVLKAETSSESAAASAEENVEDEDMPAISVPSFNGVSDHLEKEDLLGDSDSSASHNEDNKSGIKEDSDSEEKPNAKRRKALAISSDSEVGSSRKKDTDFGDKMSDFEDSDDSDITNKRTKRKKKTVDSDASVGSNSSNEGGKKKRRRIKTLRDSDASGSESETEGRNKHGRKNIRKVMGKNQLEEATKKAAREEKERIARIAERQKIYNNMQFDESGKPDEVVLDKVVLDFDPETKEPLIEVDRGLVKKLKPHQANGIKFMWDACFESVKRIKKDKGSGCILAHCMGLGKTLQVVTLTHTLLTHGDLTRTNRVLVVCPLSTVLNWVNEFRMWLKYAETEFDVEVYELSRYKQNSERAFQLSQWFRHGGVCVLGYEMFRNLSADNSKKFKKKMLKSFQEALVDPGPDLVVCDEGHLLKNEKTSLSQSMNRVKTLRRIVLTGTPLQNNLKEYYCMVQFVKPNLLGKYNEYLNRFVNPITNGQYTDSTEHDIKIMKRRSHVLHKMLDGAVQRRDYGVLAPFLPPKHEYVLFITLSEVQTKLYQHYLDNFSRRPLPGKSSGFLFPDFQSLQRIWTHPLVLKYNSERYEIMQQKKRDKEEEDDSEGSLRDFIDDDSTSEESTTDELTDDSSELSDDSRKKSKKKKKSAKKSKGKDKDSKGEGQSRPRRGTRANPVEIDEEEKDDDVIELKNENPTEWWIKLVTDDELEDMRNSHKLVLLFDILRQCETIGDKLLVFSQSLYSLDLIEHFLGKVDDATQEGRIDEKLGGHIGTWSPGIDYFRLDGSTSCENRSIWCKNFNREDNPRARLFLISTRAGGLGINLVAANRVVIFDVSWNPSHDVQSIFRVYRFGQKKPCYVYRFLAMGTMEEKIYERQVTKQAISKRVIDEQQIDRHYAENDLAELYKFEPQPPTPRPIPPLPKDRLFAEMLREHEAQIYKYHEHDSLLENKEEETLSEEERKAAWEDFENEKNRPPPAPFPSTWQMNVLQQQQLAYAALAAMLRKDMPNVSDNQLRDMIPLIYNSNPQLMQKMSEIYKYAPTMMNPGMMNPGVMNAGVGAVAPGGMSGASGLQYEPPWQRQQQQQQQMRLQQLLQQQNPMGAKFYAGGLGSRDPVAMALQHQRAREIMMGGGAGGAVGRPRGRPPMQPRAPPSGDIVNLDSD